MNDLISLSHFDRFVVFDHDFVKAIAENSDLAHHRVVIVVELLGLAHGLIGTLLQLVELISLSSCLALKIVKLAALDSQVLLDIALALVATSGFLGRHILLLELAIKNFVFRLQSLECLLVLSLLLFAIIDLS